MENLDIEKLKTYINDLEEQIVPLTKKAMNKTKQTLLPIVEMNPEVIPDLGRPPIPPSTPKPKIRKQYDVSDKKMQALALAREKKNINHELRTKQKKLEYAKMLFENESVQPVKKIAPKPKQIIQESESESESEEDESPQVIYIKKPKKKKSTKKPIIIHQESDSDSSGSEESDPIPIKKAFGKSHKNKKSVIKIHKEPPTQPQQSKPRSFVNYFCD